MVAARSLPVFQRRSCWGWAVHRLALSFSSRSPIYNCASIFAMLFRQLPDPRFLLMSPQCLRHTATLLKKGNYKAARQFVDLYLLRTAARERAADSEVISPPVAPDS